MRRRSYQQYTSPRPIPRGLDVVTTLRHFALVTYTIDPDMLKAMLPARLSPLTIELDGDRRALMSVVSFVNSRFRSAVYPSPSLNMAQINYRAYVVDEETGEHAIWFIGTLLDSWAFIVPRYFWQMPWCKSRIRLEYEQAPAHKRGSTREREPAIERDRTRQPDPAARLYSWYRVRGKSHRVPVDVELAQNPDVALSLELPGFPDVETGLVCLTHAFNGFYRRRDGKIGINRVWHEPMPVQPALLVHASFPLLDTMRLVARSDQMTPYSVLMAPAIEFISHLPPTVVSD